VATSDGHWQLDPGTRPGGGYRDGPWQLRSQARRGVSDGRPGANGPGRGGAGRCPPAGPGRRPRATVAGYRPATRPPAPGGLAAAGAACRLATGSLRLARGSE
jgi:hypothetical protein